MHKSEKIIQKRFKLKRGDTPPFYGRVKRNVIAEIIGEAGFKIGAEIGVRRGEFSRLLLDSMDDGKMILVDPWSAYKGDTGDKFSQEKADSFYKMTMDKFVGLEDRIIVKRKKSMEAINEVEDGSLDFVYLDALHDFDHAMVDIIEWSRKVKSGGIVSGHDYFHGYNYGIIHAVDVYAKCHNIYNYFITGDNIPSWLWVKK